MPVQAILSDMEDIQQSIARVAPELDAIDASDLAPLNVDLVSATSIALGVADRVRSYRDRMAKLPEFDLTNVDKLVDYAKATYGLYLDNQPPPAPAEAEALMREASELRSKLLVWSVPLVAAGHFDEAAVARVRSGSGHKDIPADLIQLVTLYRRSWSEVQAICGVTEQDIERAAAQNCDVAGPDILSHTSAAIPRRGRDLDGDLVAVKPPRNQMQPSRKQVLASGDGRSRLASVTSKADFSVLAISTRLSSS